MEGEKERKEQEKGWEERGGERQREEGENLEGYGIKQGERRGRGGRGRLINQFPYCLLNRYQ